MPASSIEPGDIVGAAKPGKYWEAEVVAVFGDLIRVTIGKTYAGPIVWTIPSDEVFRVWRR